MVQLNTPYPATPVLTGFLKEQGVEVTQADLSLAVALRLFSREGVEQALACAEELENPSPHLETFLADSVFYLRGIDAVIPFLQGRSPELAWAIGRRGFLPENTHFRELDPSNEGLDGETLASCFGTLGIQDRAKMFASLFLDDLADVFREAVDPEFGFSKYAERLALAAPSFEPFHERLTSGQATAMDELIDELTIALLDERKPDVVGLTIPFPGTVYGAFRVAACVRRHAPKTQLVLGGGYVNSELRSLSDKRVFDYVDFICFDDGFEPWLGILGKAEKQRLLTRDTWYPAKESKPGAYRVQVSDYTGLAMDRYLSMIETANPMHRLWSDGRWLKVQLSNGCYWHQCAFCDVGLDYIGCYRQPDPVQAVEAIERMKQETGISAFHFTDEALAPALMRRICQTLLERGIVITWWGNIRFDEGFDEELAALMSDSGCIGISAGLECATDRLLKLMNKGITLQRTRDICERLSENEILVHVYLMYGFPTETEEETLDALEFVRQLYEDDLIQSSYWHRFALTVHSPIAQHPEKFGIRLLPQTEDKNRFALNEIGFEEPGAPDHDALGEGLRVANYNFMRGVGLDVPIDYWFGGDGDEDPDDEER